MNCPLWFLYLIRSWMLRVLSRRGDAIKRKIKFETSISFGTLLTKSLTSFDFVQMFNSSWDCRSILVTVQLCCFWRPLGFLSKAMSGQRIGLPFKYTKDVANITNRPLSNTAGEHIVIISNTLANNFPFWTREYLNWGKTFYD